MKKTHLNKNEEKVMQILWKLDKVFLKEVVQAFPEPKLPSTTIASIIKKLESLGLVNHKTYNKSHQYFPVLKEDKYKHVELKNLLGNYFNSDIGEMVSFFMQKEKTNIEELEKIFEEIKANKNES